MALERRATDPGPRDWEGLLQAVREHGDDDPQARVELVRSLARALPGAGLGRVIEELQAEEARQRGERYDDAVERARAAAARGELADARAQAEAACRIDFSRWEAHQVLGDVLERSGERDAALRQYVTAVQLGWEHEDARKAVRRLR